MSEHASEPDIDPRPTVQPAEQLATLDRHVRAVVDTWTAFLDEHGESIQSKALADLAMVRETIAAEIVLFKQLCTSCNIMRYVAVRALATFGIRHPLEVDPACETESPLKDAAVFVGRVARAFDTYADASVFSERSKLTGESEDEYLRRADVEQHRQEIDSVIEESEMLIGVMKRYRQLFKK